MLPASERLLLFKERLRACTCPGQSSRDKRRALLEVVDAAAIDVPLPLKVLRAGRELTLSVKPEPLPGMA